MPKTTQLLSKVQKLYRRQAIDLLLLGYVQGCTDTVETFTEKMAIGLFRKRLGITEDEYTTDTMLTTLQRMRKEYMDINKTI